MFNSNQVNTIFPVFLAFIFSAMFMGQAYQPVKGLSHYNAAAMQFEETVFQKKLEIAQKKEFEKKEAQRRIQLANYRKQKLIEKKIKAYEMKIESKIQDVIAHYQKRMDPQHLEEIPGMILEESKKHGFDPMFLTALIITESSFNNKAKSHKGALGLMQILPGTGVAMASENEMEWKGSPTLYNPEVNIALGSYYLKKLQRRFGDLVLALEAYNHGPTRLDKYLKRGFQPKTYSTKVLKIYQEIDFDRS